VLTGLRRQSIYARASALVAVLALTMGFGACGLASSASAATSLANTSANRAGRPCTFADLEIRVTHGGAAGPTVGGYLTFTNRSSTACVLTGWPKVSTVSRTGAVRPAHDVRTTQFGPTQFGPNVTGIPHVAVAPGRRADAVFVSGDFPGSGATSCPTPYRWLRVGLASDARTATVSPWISGLGAYLPACTGVDISMFVAPQALYHG